MYAKNIAREEPDRRGTEFDNARTTDSHLSTLSILYVLLLMEEKMRRTPHGRDG